MFDFADDLHGDLSLQNLSGKRDHCTKNQTTIDNVSSESATVNSKGQQLFKQNCASCHALDRDLTGPALHGVAQRGPWEEDKSNLKQWIKNPATFILTDAYAKNLREKYGLQMPAQTQLSDADIEEVIGYITQ